MLVAGVLILAVQSAVVSGRLTVLEGKDLVCVSDDDGAGLTWNTNMDWNEYAYELHDRQSDSNFQNPNQPRLKSPLNCELNQHRMCINFWSTEDWSMTSSMKTPIGPVLDRRWEGFEEKAEELVFNQHISSVQSFVVSIRGPGYGVIHICIDTGLNPDLCYWIRISGLSNIKSMLTTCSVHKSEFEMEQNNDTCLHQQYNSEMLLSPIEWKTFVVTWNESTKNISVFHNERIILTLVDSEITLLEDSSYLYLHLSGTPMALFRLHDYNFLHTTKRYAVLASPELIITTNNFCVEMAVGLCAECQLELTLANPSSKKIEHTLEVIRGSPTVYGFPAWQYVRVNKSIPLENSTVELRMFTILKQETPNPLWAVANVRWCPPAGSIRKGRKKMSQVYGESKSSWPDIACQKLFYNENTVVDSLHPATLDEEFVDSNCELGKVGPHCSINCTEDLQLEADCKNAKICEKAGCTCSSGYTGPHCDERSAPKQSTTGWNLPTILPWLTPIVLGIILAFVAFYLYRRRRMKRRTGDGPHELLPCTASPKNAQPGDAWLRISPGESKS